MATRITAHGCEVDTLLRKRVDVLSRRWPRFDPAVMDVSVVFRLEGRSHSVEAIVSRRRRQPVVARGEGPDFRVALDDLDTHVRRRLRRDRSRRKGFRHASSDFTS
ncbi:MAG: hypothetical protein OXQ94_03260 [Gemmatimonadota bacterium]|nr:hypothetical protein [Gemmatimonadota bacterium]MDE2870697.1 hypothetical protein [Gemmatimonadota bacterium]